MRPPGLEQGRVAGRDGVMEEEKRRGVTREDVTITADERGVGGEGGKEGRGRGGRGRVRRRVGGGEEGSLNGRME